ncbi:MAG: protein ImuA [bacterium]|jgi:protein ImuA
MFTWGWLNLASCRLKYRSQTKQAFAQLSSMTGFKNSQYYQSMRCGLLHASIVISINITVEHIMNIYGIRCACMTSKITRLRLNQKPASKRKDTCILSEAFPTVVTDAGAVGFILAQLGKTGAPLLWVQDRISRKETGSPYLPGMHHKNIIRVDVNRPVDVLWTMEEGLRCKALSCVIGEIWGDPPALNFTATKRLAMRAEANKVPCWLIRRSASPDLSAARDRWRIASLPSLPHLHDHHSPGAPRWQAELFRSRTQPPGTWVVSYDRTADCLNFAAPFRDGTVAAGDGKAGQRSAR